MEYIKALSFFLLGLASLVLVIKQREYLSKTILFLLTLATTFLLVENINPKESNQHLAYIIVLYVSLNFLLSFIQKLREFRFSWIVPVVLLSVFLYFGSTIFQFNEYDFSFSNLVLFLLPVFGAIAQPVTQWKSAFFSKLFGLEGNNNFENNILIFFIGFASFLGSYFASSFGIFLIALGFIASSFYRDNEGRNAAIVLLFLSLLYYFPRIVGIDVIDLSLGKTLEGIFLGSFTILFLHLLSKTRKNFIVVFLSGLFLSFGFLFVLLLLYTQKSDLGGVDAYIGAMVGISITILLIPTFKFSELVFSIIISGGLIFSPMLINKEEQQMTQITISSDGDQGNELKDPHEMKGILLDSIIGSYHINEKTTQLNFQLGPKGGITKGTFKRFSGKVKINKEIENSSFFVELPIAELTTFNKIRDESLAEENYFNSAKYPTLRFESKMLKKEKDGYKLLGEFTMLGVTKSLDVNIKYIGKFDSNGKMVPVLVGKSSIDRTLFGMKPDSKEGNIVDFEFKVELISE